MTTTPTRLPTLPKDIREGFRSYADSHYAGHRVTPEETNSRYNLFRRETDETAAIRLENITYYRGRASSRGDDGTKVFIVAVYGGKVVSHTSRSVRTDYERKKSLSRWNTLPDEVVDYDDPTQRQRALIAGEYIALESLKKTHASLVEKAKAKLAKETHEALASTKLAQVRGQIATAVVHLKDLRGLERKLARLAKKEETTAAA